MSLLEQDLSLVKEFSRINRYVSLSLRNDSIAEEYKEEYRKWREVREKISILENRAVCGGNTGFIIINENVEKIKKLMGNEDENLVLKELKNIENTLDNKLNLLESNH